MRTIAIGLLRLETGIWNFLYRPRGSCIDDNYSVSSTGLPGFSGLGLLPPCVPRTRCPSIRVHDDVRLVRRAPLEVDVADPAHVLLLAALADAAVVVGNAEPAAMANAPRMAAFSAYFAGLPPLLAAT